MTKDKLQRTKEFLKVCSDSSDLSSASRAGILRGKLGLGSTVHLSFGFLGEATPIKLCPIFEILSNTLPYFQWIVQ